MLKPVETTKEITANGIVKNNMTKLKEEFEHLTYLAEITARTSAFCEDVIGENIQQAAEKGKNFTYLYSNGKYSIYTQDESGYILWKKN